VLRAEDLPRRAAPAIAPRPIAPVSRHPPRVAAERPRPRPRTQPQPQVVDRKDLVNPFAADEEQP
jgi:hypothetical protein